MAIRKSKEESFLVNDTLTNLITQSESSLENGGFRNIKVNSVLNQITADYKKLTVNGNIIVTFHEEGAKVKIHVKSTANADNVFALFSSPNQKIIDQFKNNL